MAERILRLTLNKEAFEITGTEEKPFELRHDGDWIWSRLVDRNGVRKPYDSVLLTHGYGNDKPFKKFVYRGFRFTQHPIHWEFSNGLKFYQRTGDIIIDLGELIDSRL